MSAEDVDKALAAHSGELMSIPGVAGVGQGLCKGRPCIKVFVARKTRELQKRIMGILEGIPVDVVETGGIKPLGKGK